MQLGNCWLLLDLNSMEMEMFKTLILLMNFEYVPGDLKLIFPSQLFIFAE
jgi:hypothetical protein